MRRLLLAPLFFALLGCPSQPLEEARALEAAGQSKEAGQRYVAIAKADPADLGAWDAAVNLWCKKEINVAECMGVLELELDLLGNVARHHQVLSEVLESRARARLEQGMADAALDDLARAEKAAPERASVQSAKAKVLLSMGRGPDALSALNRAKLLDPHEAEAEALLKEMAQPANDGFGGSAPASN